MLPSKTNFTIKQLLYLNDKFRVKVEDVGEGGIAISKNILLCRQQNIQLHVLSLFSELHLRMWQLNMVSHGNNKIDFQWSPIISKSKFF